MEPAPGGRDALRVGTPEDVVSARSDLCGGHGGAGDICGSGYGNGGSDSAEMPVPHDKCACDDNAQPAHCGPTASGGIRPGDSCGGRADVVEVDLCSIDVGGSASDEGGLRAPSGCGGDIGDSGGGLVRASGLVSLVPLRLAMPTSFPPRLFTSRLPPHGILYPKPLPSLVQYDSAEWELVKWEPS